MVDTFPTVKSRIAHVRDMCGVPTPAAFSKWIGAGSPQAVNAWITRDSITKAGAKKVAGASGANPRWLIFGEGEPFPKGPTPYSGALPDTAESRLRVAEDELDAIKSVMVVVLRILSEKLPAVGPEMAALLATLPGDTPAKRQVVEAAAGAAALGQRAAAQEVRSVGPAVSRGKPQPRTR